jgi:hypothetical protein
VPGSIVKANAHGIMKLVGSLEERTLSLASGARGEHHAIEHAMARVRPRQRGASGADAFSLVNCEYKTGGAIIDDKIALNDPLTHELVKKTHCFVRFQEAHDAMFSTSSDSTYFAFDETELKHVWRAAQALLDDSEAIVIGAAFCRQLVAYMADSPGSVLGFVAADNAGEKIDMSKYGRFADIALERGLHVKVHHGEVMYVDQKDCVPMYSVCFKAGSSAYQTPRGVNRH